MGKKRRGHPDVEELLARPWCYYCERDFEDLKLLISHQKAKHFKCDRCGKRLNTAGGLSVHMNQVHKESLTTVENALPNRQGLDIEIFGMEGVPEDIMQQHNQRIIQNFYTDQQERYAATGNPPPGQSGQGPAKKIKIEAAEDLKKRLAEYRAKGGAQNPAANGSAQKEDVSPATNIPAPQGAFPYPPSNIPGAPSISPLQQLPPAFPPGGAPLPGAPGTFGLPARPPAANALAGSNLPPRPQFGGAPYNGSGSATTLDDLVASGSRQLDDIDQVIRMAEAGIKAPKPGAEDGAAAGDKKAKKEKDKSMRMVYSSSETSPEEVMARFGRFAVASA